MGKKLAYAQKRMQFWKIYLCIQADSIENMAKSGMPPMLPEDQALLLRTVAAWIGDALDVFDLSDADLQTVIDEDATFLKAISPVHTDERDA